MSAGWPDRQGPWARVVLVGTAVALVGVLAGVARPGAAEVEGGGGPARSRPVVLLGGGGLELVVVPEKASVFRVLAELKEPGVRGGAPVLLGVPALVVCGVAWVRRAVVPVGSGRAAGRALDARSSRAPPRAR